MEYWSNLALGFQTAFGWEPLLFCFVGVTLGTFVGVLPGIGALAAISMLLPVTFYLDPISAIIMLAGIYYGAQYGGSTASILLNTPGTVTQAVTCLDGHPMAKQGRAGVALFTTTITSFIGGSFAILLLMFLAPVLAGVALSFGSAEYFAVILFGLVVASTLSGEAPLKGFAMVALGVMLGFIGIDGNSGAMRYQFGFYELSDGLNLVAVAMGLFGIAEILNNLVRKEAAPFVVQRITLRSMLPTRQDVRDSTWPTARGTLIGSFAGILPGTGAAIAPFIAYITEKRLSRTPERFGNGAIEGIASPEASNNAAAQAAFVPTLSLGIPGDAVMAIMLGALMIHGIVPGPQLISQQPTLFWALIASFWIGNLMLLVLNIPLIGLWVRVLQIPYHILYPTMLFLICVGVYSTSNSMMDVGVALVFGVIGYFMILLRFPTAPLLLGFILGPLMEVHLRRALMISQGDFSTFVSSTIGTGFLIASAVVIVFSIRSARLARMARLGVVPDKQEA